MEKHKRHRFIRKASGQEMESGWAMEDGASDQTTALALLVLGQTLAWANARGGRHDRVQQICGDRCNLRRRLVRGGMQQVLVVHQPARQHGCSRFLEPFVKQRRHFLSQIRCVVHSRELKVAKAGNRGGPQKLPRWIKASHGFLQREVT